MYLIDKILFREGCSFSTLEENALEFNVLVAKLGLTPK